MKRGLTAFIVASLLLTGCGVNRENAKRQEISSTGVGGFENEEDKKNGYHGFFDVSYENEVGEKVRRLESMEELLYEENGSYVGIKTGIEKCLAGENKDQYDYMKIFLERKDEDMQKYLVLENKKTDEGYYFDIYLVESGEGVNIFELKESLTVEGSINESKTSVFLNENKILVSTEAPGSSYIENYYIENKGGKFEYLETRTMDITADFLEKKISLIQSGKLKDALELEGSYLYPYTYQELISKSNNIALGAFYEKAKELYEKDDYKEGLRYLEGEVELLIERAATSSDGNYWDYFIKNQSDGEKVLEKEEIEDVLKLYRKLLVKTGETERASEIQSEIKLLLSRDQSGGFENAWIQNEDWMSNESEIVFDGGKGILKSHGNEIAESWYRHEAVFPSSKDFKISAKVKVPEFWDKYSKKDAQVGIGIFVGKKGDGGKLVYESDLCVVANEIRFVQGQMIKNRKGGEPVEVDFKKVKSEAGTIEIKYDAKEKSLSLIFDGEIVGTQKIDSKGAVDWKMTSDDEFVLGVMGFSEWTDIKESFPSIEDIIVE